MSTVNKRISLSIVTLVASLGGFLFGFDMAVISGVLPLVQEQFGLSAAQSGWFVSSALVGCIIGVIVSGEMTDRLGRKKPLIVTAVLFIASALGCALLPSLSAVILARIIGGVGIGIASNVVPLYISEIAPQKVRGKLVTYYQFALTFGILCAYLSNAGLLNVWNGFLSIEVWRGMLGVGVVPAVLFFAGLLMIPESPRWLMLHGRMQEGLQILNAIGGRGDAALEPVKAIDERKAEKGSYKDLFAPAFRRALLIGILLPLFSQFSGINAIIYYGPSILKDAGISLDNSLVSQIIFGVANMLFTLIAIWKVDSWGRRPLYIFGTAGAAITLVATGLCFYTGATQSLWLLLCVLAFLACFAFSIGPLKFVVASEIFPNAIRGRAMAISIMVMWISDTIVGQLTPVLLEKVGAAGTFWFFAFFCAIAFFTVYKMLPETKGKSLEQIEDEWKTGQNSSNVFVH